MVVLSSLPASVGDCTCDPPWMSQQQAPAHVQLTASRTVAQCVRGDARSLSTDFERPQWLFGLFRELAAFATRWARMLEGTAKVSGCSVSTCPSRHAPFMLHATSVVTAVGISAGRGAFYAEFCTSHDQAHHGEGQVVDGTGTGWGGNAEARAFNASATCDNRCCSLQPSVADTQAMEVTSGADYRRRRPHSRRPGGCP